MIWFSVLIGQYWSVYEYLKNIHAKVSHLTATWAHKCYCVKPQIQLRGAAGQPRRPAWAEHPGWGGVRPLPGAQEGEAERGQRRLPSAGRILAPSSGAKASQTLDEKTIDT